MKLTKLWEADPADADVAYMIALEHAKAGDVEEAVRWLDQAIALNTSYHYAYYQKGKLLGEAGRLDEGRAALQTGLKQAQCDGNAKAVGELQALLEEMT